LGKSFVGASDLDRHRGNDKVNSKPVVSEGFTQQLKSQISSTKLQINLKFQYSMTKTFTAAVSHHFAKMGLSVMMP
jgi:hypothetical protein